MVDGEATQLKWAAMETRAWEGGEGERRRRRRTGRRPHLQSYVDEVSIKLMHMYYCACILSVLLFKTTEVVQQISQKIYMYMYMYITAGLPRWLSWYSVCLECRTSRVRVPPEAALGKKRVVSSVIAWICLVSITDYTCTCTIVRVHVSCPGQLSCLGGSAGTASA